MAFTKSVRFGLCIALIFLQLTRKAGDSSFASHEFAVLSGTRKLESLVRKQPEKALFSWFCPHSFLGNRKTRKTKPSSPIYPLFYRGLIGLGHYFCNKNPDSPVQITKCSEPAMVWKHTVAGFTRVQTKLVIPLLRGL
ncbi:hypothetical protein Pr1d_30310 [Bythopirellula goksoeyrii]|uniref:Uncharacterized protein n=1 Tax=Bythopirellula goksoeyrii TaxID=1400387 RepID=A0A5B9QA23_9BACT|nr:hypothetical protein Pr1d_30310 [Bythopirellula goksoeyrii]